MSDYEHIREQLGIKYYEQITNYHNIGRDFNYFTDNELDWNGWRRGMPLFDYYLGKPSQAPGKVALVNLLRERYDGDIRGLNAAWHVDLAGFDDLLVTQLGRRCLTGPACAIAYEAPGDCRQDLLP